MSDKAMLDILSIFTQATDESKPLTEGKRTVTADTAMADILGKLNTLNESAEPVITEGKMPSKKHVMDMCKDGMSKKEMCDMHPDCDQGKLKDMIDDCKEEMKDSKEEMDEASCGSSMKKRQMKESAIAEGVAQIEVRLTEAFKIFKDKPATSYSAPISSAGGSVKGSYGQSEKTPKVIAKPETPPKAPKPQRDQSWQGEKTPKVIAKPETPSSPLAQIGKSPNAADTKSAADLIAQLQGSGGSAADLIAQLQGSGDPNADPFAKFQGSVDPNADPFAKYQENKDIKGYGEDKSKMAPMPYIPGKDKSKMKNLPYIPGEDKSELKNLPYIPGKDKSELKNLPYIPGTGKGKVRPMPSFPGTGKGKMAPMPTPKGFNPGKGKMAPMPTPKGFNPGKGKMAPMPTPKGFNPGEPETDPFAIYREQIASLREQIASLREEPNEGNKFSGALAQADQDGKDEFEVDGKKYKVTTEMFDKQDEVGSKKKTKHGTAEKTATGMKHTRDYKPDYLDLDGDGDKKEPMKKAAKDAENKKKS